MFDPETLKGRSTEAAVYWRAAAASSTELARQFRVRAEAAEAKLARIIDAVAPHLPAAVAARIAVAAAKETR